VNRRGLLQLVGLAPAASVITPSFAEVKSFPISDRWMAIGNLPTDEIWWRYDIAHGFLPPYGRLLFPTKGSWRIAPTTLAELEKRYAIRLQDIRKRILATTAKPPTKLTLCGPLREHYASDHDQSELGASYANIWARYEVIEGPPVGWV
jgi:hypothetical protein